MAHFVLLIAGSQVPYRLRWKEDLAKLHPFSRKLLWTYWAFTGLTIIAFGALTLFLHDEMLRGDRAALATAAFICIFWIARIVVECLYFSHRDWPPGEQFLIGHILLTSVFVFLAVVYAWVLLRGLV